MMIKNRKFWSIIGNAKIENRRFAAQTPAFYE